MVAVCFKAKGLNLPFILKKLVLNIPTVSAVCNLKKLEADYLKVYCAKRHSVLKKLVKNKG